MSRLTPYIMFPGACRAAMHFYADVLGGKVVLMQSYAEAPIDVPAEFHDRIFNSEMRAGAITIKASDDLPSHPVRIGGNIALYVEFADKSAQIAVFNKLADGGNVLFPLRDSFGMLEDKFGIRWMVVHNSDVD